MSFWNENGVRSKGVRQVLWSRTAVFEKDASRERKRISRFVFQGSSQRCNSLRKQHVTSKRHTEKKRLHPTVIRHVALNRFFPWPPDWSTLRIEKNDWRSNSRGRAICSAGDAVCRHCPKNACLFIGPDEPGTAGRDAATGKRGRSRRDPSGLNRTGRAKILNSHSAAIHQG
jgi:hypothetical protein